MSDDGKTKAQLIRGLDTLRQRILTLEASERAQKQETKELQKSEEHYRTLVESSLGLICLHDLDGTILYANLTAARAMGYQPQELVGQNLRSGLSPANQHLFDSYLERIRQHSTATGLMHVATKSGEERVWAYQNVRYEEPGKAPYVLGHAQDITEYRRAKKALRESEEHLRHLIEGSIQGIIIHRNFKPLFVNQAFAEAFGYDSPNDILRMENVILEIAAPYELNRLRHYAQARMRGESAPTYFEYQGLKKDGSQVWVINIAKMVTWGDLPAIQSTIFNVTEHKQAEEALRDSEMNFRNLLEGSIQGVFVHTDGIIQFANTAMARLCGYAGSNELIGQDFRVIMDPRERARVEGYRQCRLRGDPAPAYYECQGVKKDGSPLWFACLMSRVPWNGRPSLMSTFLDITARKQAEEALQQAHAALEQRVEMRNAELRAANTILQQEIIERKRAEEALRQSEKRYRELFENANDIVFTHDLAGYVTWINKAAERLSGYTRDEALRMNITDVIVPEHQALAREMQDRKYAGTTTATTYELDIITKGGNQVSLEVCTQFLFQDEEPVEILGIARDITERKRLEERVRQTQKMEAIGALAGGIAHDFNNLLYAILGFAELALGDVSPHSSAWANLQEVITAGQRARDMVQQILTFSHQNSPQRCPLLLSPLIRETLKLLRGTLPSTITIRTHLVAPSGMVLANATQLQQVLMNLCSNAEYAMRATGGVLDVQLEALHVTPACAAIHSNLRSGPCLRLVVRDTGPGMPTEVLARVFEPFFTTKAAGEGTGMGLAVAHGIITSHGGAIEVTSAPGQGTAFEVYLPQINELTTTDEATDEAVPDAQLSRGSECILFVDDEEALTRVVQGMLQRLGYKIEVYTSSIETLAAFRTAPERFDLVITDQTMPDMTGEELVGELRRIRPDIPIILCTGYSYLIDHDKAETLGIDAFCLKPLQGHELVSIIRKVMAQRGRQIS